MNRSTTIEPFHSAAKTWAKVSPGLVPAELFSARIKGQKAPGGFPIQLKPLHRTTVHVAKHVLITRRMAIRADLIELQFKQFFSVRPVGATRRRLLLKIKSICTLNRMVFRG